jgi:hypothetical protein
VYKGGSWQTLQVNLPTEKNGAKPNSPAVTVAGHFRRSAGDAVAASVFVRTAWNKIFGECRATGLRGNARTAGSGTVLGISKISLTPEC